MAISSKVALRVATELKKYQSILSSAKQRDVSESNTVTIVGDMLSDVLGYDKYQHVTSEYSIRGTYVDLAVVVDENIRFLIEVKAIGLELKDAHIKQAVDYGANLGVEWVVLTNGAVWRVYKIHFGQPIDKALIFEIDVLTANPKHADVVECFGNLSREGFSKGSMSELLQQKQITSRFAVAAILLSESMVDQLRRELRRISPGLKVDAEYLGSLLANEVIKRELVDSDEAHAAEATIKRLHRSLAREKKRSAERAATEKEAPSDGVTMTQPISTPPTHIP
jgi:hypothetical protein